MPRRMIVRQNDIYVRRGNAWASHYQSRELAKCFLGAGYDGVRIASALACDLPVPEMGIDGYCLDVPLLVRQKHFNSLLESFRLSPLYTDLLCCWYWTDSGWMELVRQYQSLPDVDEDYYYLYEKEADRLVLVPMSSKVRLGTTPQNKVHLGHSSLAEQVSTVDNPVDNLGTTRRLKVQVR